MNNTSLVIVFLGGILFFGVLSLPPMASKQLNRTDAAVSAICQTVKPEYLKEGACETRK